THAHNHHSTRHRTRDRHPSTAERFQRALCALCLARRMMGILAGPNQTFLLHPCLVVYGITNLTRTVTAGNRPAPPDAAFRWRRGSAITTPPYSSDSGALHRAGALRREGSQALTPPWPSTLGRCTDPA